MFSQRKITSISKLTLHVVCWSTFASERFRSELNSYFFSHLFIIGLQYLRSQKVIKAYTVHTAFLWLLHYAFCYYFISMNRVNYCRIHPCNSLGTLKTRLPYQNSLGMKLWVTGHSISQWSCPQKRRFALVRYWTKCLFSRFNKLSIQSDLQLVEWQLWQNYLAIYKLLPIKEKTNKITWSKWSNLSG